MNYYKHHIGDYAKKTAHLTVLEHGAYLLMLHAYYGTEKPLPTGETLYRMLRAQSKAERAAVDSIASQFWTPTETGWVNGRAFEEIEHASHLVENARQNGNRGGRPKITQRVSENNPVGSFSEPSGKAIQTPDSNTPVTNNQKEQDGGRERVRAKRSSPATRISPDFELTPERRAYARDHGLDPDAVFAMFTTYWRGKGAGGAKADWDATWQHWVLKDSKAQSEKSKPRKTRFEELTEHLNVD